MRDRLAEAAKSNNRTLNAEIVARLSASLEQREARAITVDELNKMMIAMVDGAVERRVSEMVAKNPPPDERAALDRIQAEVNLRKKMAADGEEMPSMVDQFSEAVRFYQMGVADGRAGKEPGTDVREHVKKIKAEGALVQKKRL